MAPGEWCMSQREFLDHILILSEGHARRLAKEYVQYFNYARPHQGIDGQLPIPSPSAFLLPPRNGSLRRMPVLSGFTMITSGLLDEPFSPG